MADFSQAVEVVLAHEGGFVDHPNDPGGATKYGITLPTLREAGFDMDGNGLITKEDINKLSREAAMEIYRQYWWERYGYGKIEDQALATKVFDFSVNMGPSAAHRLLQRALRAAETPVSEDGVLGPETLGAAARADPRVLLAALRSEGAGFYRLLAAQKPELSVFLAGWLSRAYA